MVMFMSLYSEINNRIRCYYVNSTHQIQIIRITNIPNWNFEKAIFPKERLMFEAFPQALLEIHTGVMASSLLSDTIQCNLLRVQEEVNQLYLQADIA